MHASLPEAVARFGVLLVELLALFLAVAFALAIVQRRWIQPERLRSLLGGTGRVWPLAKGALLGTVTPFCSCAGIPILASLLRARVRFGTAAAFLLASPLLNPVLLAIVALLFGWPIAAGYAIIVLPATIGAAAVWEALGLDRHLKVGRPAAAPVAVPASAGAGSCAAGDQALGACDTEPSGGCGPPRPAPAGDADAPPPVWQGWPLEARAALGEALATMRPVFVPLLLGVGVGALIYGLVPQGTLAHVAGDGNPVRPRRSGPADRLRAVVRRGGRRAHLRDGGRGRRGLVA
jgi:uncharacterized protein